MEPVAGDQQGVRPGIGAPAPADRGPVTTAGPRGASTTGSRPAIHATRPRRMAKPGRADLRSAASLGGYCSPQFCARTPAWR